LAIALFTLAACKKNNGPNPSTNVDVYMAGVSNAASGYIVATYWKNNVANRVKDSTITSIANSVSVSGSDVYIAGYTQDANSATVATYWKNGVAVPLTVADPSSVWTLATGIVVQGTDVYVVGYVAASGYYTAVYWKNGIPTEFTQAPNCSQATAIALNGTDVYIAGLIGPTKSLGGAAYWKNGALITLSDQSTPNAAATSIAVNGTDVYVGGQTFSGTADNALYWKNGVQHILVTGSLLIGSYTVSNQVYAGVSSIAVNGSDVYCGGSSAIAVNNGGAGTLNDLVGHYSATYWKNGVMTTSSTGSIGGIALNGNDLYMAGSLSNGTGAFWKNGTMTTLGAPASNTEPRAIVLVKR